MEWRGSRRSRPARLGLLASAYRVSLRLAAEHDAKTVAFPSISTGVYGYPIEQAATIALQTLVDEAPEHGFDEVRFVLFSRPDLRVYRDALATLNAA